MAETKTKTKNDDDVEVGPVAGPAVGDSDATYVDPDLSFQTGVGELPDEEKEWHEARDKAREEGVKAAEEAEEQATEERRKRKADELKERQEQAGQQVVVTPVAGTATTSGPVKS